jgi:ribulose 1,5-bisphosphate carboxylase large subunit-like protein
MSESNSTLFRTKGEVPKSSLFFTCVFTFVEGLYDYFNQGVEEFINVVNGVAINSQSTPQQSVIVTDVRPNEGGIALSGQVDIAIPVEIIGEQGGIALLISILTYFSSYSCIKQFGVIRMELSSSTALQLQLRGPIGAFESESRVRLGTIFRPRFARNEDNFEEYLNWLVDAGNTIYVEDELTISQSNDSTISQVANRARAICARGGKGIYVANLTVKQSRLLPLIEQLIKLDNRSLRIGVMINVITMGFDVVSDIRALFPNIPIVANVIGRGMLCAGRDYFIDEEVICRLARLCGADAVYTGPFAGKIQNLNQRNQRIFHSLNNNIFVDDNFHIPPSYSIMSGGLFFKDIYRNAAIYRGRMICLLGGSMRHFFESGIPPQILNHALEFAQSIDYSHINLNAFETDLLYAGASPTYTDNFKKTLLGGL